ncbi:hypothetical protein J3E68DRAFT_416352 [Trichoderma sp. SZMC 28012]
MPLLPIPSTPALLLPTRFISPKPLSSLFGHTTRPVGVDVALLVTLLFAFALPCPVFCIAPPSLLHCFHEHLPSFIPSIVRIFVCSCICTSSSQGTYKALPLAHLFTPTLPTCSAQLSPAQSTESHSPDSHSLFFVFTLTAVTSLSPLLG